jgi:predicted AlkP superfamily phosphohydrolase/phosphomutase
MKPRLLAIGLDAADPDLVLGWAREGQLPTIGGLLKRGTWTRLRSPADISTGPAWPSFFASSNPARQGRFFFRQLRSGTYRIEKKRAIDIDALPFWCDLSAVAAPAVAVLDVPKTVPQPEISGVQLMGWGVHSAGHRTASSPPGLVKELRRRFGSYPLPNCDEFRLEVTQDYRDFSERLIAGAAQKASLSEHVLRHQSWDLAVIVFGEPHCAGHHLWHFHDPDHPRHDASRSLGDPLRDVYRAVDTGIGRLLAVAPDARVALFSPHGMGPNYAGTHLLPAVLQRLGMADGERPTVSAESARAGVRLSPGSLPVGLRRLARRMLPDRLWDELTCRLMSLDTSWSRSRAFCVPGDFAGAIRINLAGREPNGRVQPGAEFDALCAELIAQLACLENADTGRPAVERVLLIDKLYQGPHRDDLPDVVVLWTGDAPVRGLRSARIGCVRGDDPDRRSGEDRADGFLLAAGAEIGSGRSLETGDVTLLDVAPTLLHLAGCSVPARMEGRVLRELFTA